MQLNDDVVGSPASSPSVIAATGWWRMAVFASRRSDAGDIYLQRFGLYGGLEGPNRRVNQDVGASLQAEPGAAAADTHALIVWIDGRAVNSIPGQRIFGRLCTLYGALNTDEFIISDSTSVWAKLSPKVAIRPDGRALVAWLDKRDGSYQVWGHWWNPDGTGDGADFRISTVATDTQNDDLWVGTDSSGRYWAAWLDHGTAFPSVKARAYNASGVSVGSFTWSPAGFTIDEMSAAVLPAGSLAIAFTSRNGESNDISLAAVSLSGTQVLAPYAFNDLAAADPESPSISADDAGYLTAAWVDRRNPQSTVFVQAFSSGLVPIGQNQQLTNGAPNSFSPRRCSPREAWPGRCGSIRAKTV